MNLPISNLNTFPTNQSTIRCYQTKSFISYSNRSWNVIQLNWFERFLRCIFGAYSSTHKKALQNAFTLLTDDEKRALNAATLTFLQSKFNQLTNPPPLPRAEKSDPEITETERARLERDLNIPVRKYIWISKEPGSKELIPANIKLIKYDSSPISYSEVITDLTYGLYLNGEKMREMGLRLYYRGGNGQVPEMRIHNQHEERDVEHFDRGLLEMALTLKVQKRITCPLDMYGGGFTLERFFYAFGFSSWGQSHADKENLIKSVGEKLEKAITESDLQRFDNDQEIVAVKEMVVKAEKRDEAAISTSTLKQKWRELLRRRDLYMTVPDDDLFMDEIVYADLQLPRLLDPKYLDTPAIGYNYKSRLECNNVEEWHTQIQKRQEQFVIAYLQTLQRELGNNRHLLNFVLKYADCNSPI